MKLRAELGELVFRELSIVEVVGGRAFRIGQRMTLRQLGQLRDVDDTVWTVAGISLILLAGAAALAWATTERVLAPLRDLIGATREIGELDLSARLDVEGRDEIDGRFMASKIAHDPLYPRGER